jgi:hypothetical protein
MADPNWFDIWAEADTKLAQLLGEFLEGTPHVDELPDILPENQTCMYVIDFHGGGEAIETESENYETKGSENGSAVEKQVDATIIAVATTKRIARKFAESIWNALPQAPSARPIARVWVSVEPNIQRGTWNVETESGNDDRIYMVQATLSVLLTKAAEWQ